MKDQNQFALIKEMFETIEIIKNFNTEELYIPITSLRKTKKLFLTGEGSSRIFPAKNIEYQALKEFSDLTILTEGARQASELNLKDFTLFGASNSGKTKEIISLFKSVKFQSKFALTAHRNTPLGKLSDKEFILHCGNERAVAATKSVIEQALFYQTLVYECLGKKISKAFLIGLANKAELVLKSEIDPVIISRIANAKIIYFSGRNNGVAEEAALKADEIARKKSDYLEGTYVLHGIEEVMNEDEIVILIF